MDQALQQRRSLLRFRFLPPVVIALTLVVFGGTVWLVTQQLRSRVREQMIGRDGEVLNAVALIQHLRADDELGARIEEPADQFIVILETSRLAGVLAARLFTPDGDFIQAFPDYVSDGVPVRAELAQLRRLKPVCAYRADVNLSSLFNASSRRADFVERRVPMLDVLVPLYRRDGQELLGIAEFVLDGHVITRDFATLDRNLYGYAAAAFLVGGTVIVAALAWAFRRLDRTNRLLQNRTASLLNANHELALAAKTSALGTVTAHLIHGLRSPISGLQSFVSAGRAGAGDAADWQHAVASTRRVQTLISDIVRVLNEHDGLSQYEVTLAELVEMVRARTKDAAREAGVDLRFDRDGDGVLVSRDANLALLILENLIHNAIHATPAGKSVRVGVEAPDGSVVCRVQDEGPGFPAALRPSLFAPCQSSKEGGSGIGLAISKQLANHLGATLELIASSASGCVFTLNLPPTLLSGASQAHLTSRAAEPHAPTGRS